MLNTNFQNSDFSLESWNVSILVTNLLVAFLEVIGSRGFLENVFQRPSLNYHCLSVRHSFKYKWCRMKTRDHLGWQGSLTSAFPPDNHHLQFAAHFLFYHTEYEKDVRAG